MEIILKPRKTAGILSTIVLLLTLAHIAGQYSTYYLGYDNIFGLIPQFNLNSEQNIPALFSTLILLLSSILLAIITYAVKKTGASYFYNWLGLSLIFLFLSMDELLSFHESMTVPLRKGTQYIRHSLLRMGDPIWHRFTYSDISLPEILHQFTCKNTKIIYHRCCCLSFRRHRNRTYGWEN